MTTRIKPWINFRAAHQLREDVRQLADMGDRSQGWIVRQALNALFREIEEGLVSWTDVRDGVHEHGPVQSVRTDALQYGRLRDAARVHDVTRSAIVMLALTRYVSRRLPLLDGREALDDKLVERGPTLPPA